MEGGGGGDGGGGGGLDPIAPAAVIEDIERALKLEKLPSRNSQQLPPPQQYQPSEIARLFHSLKQSAKREEEKAAIPPKDKAFIAYAKAVAGVYAATFNALNFAGVALSYAIGNHSHHLNKHQNMHGVFIGMSMAFLPYSLLVVGLSHSLEEKLSWINTMAYALIAEVLYMAVMCTFFGYYLIDDAQEVLVIICVIVTTISIILPPMIAYSRPNLLDLCLKNED